ncbi:hypothetical protein VTL71DRAFT_8219, partial [Oculimacula yallundae]
MHVRIYSLYLQDTLLGGAAPKSKSNANGRARNGKARNDGNKTGKASNWPSKAATDMIAALLPCHATPYQACHFRHCRRTPSYVSRSFPGSDQPPSSF